MACERMSLQMTTIYVCIGSACHLKGSYDIINRLQALIAKQELGERVEVRAKFCMGNCGQDGVSVSVDDGPVQSLLPADTDTFFWSSRFCRAFGQAPARRKKSTIVIKTGRCFPAAAVFAYFHLDCYG